jgi:hypothetical protein
MQLSEPRSKYELPPSGTHLARLYRFVDLGWQTSTYEDEARDQHQAILGWELCGRLMSDGRPYSVSKTINLSLHEKSTFRGWAEAMVGREFGPPDLVGRNRFDVKELIGTVCLLQVEHGTSRKGNLFAKVANLMPAPEGVKAPDLVNEPYYFSLDPREFDQAVFDSLPQWDREKIEASDSWVKLQRRLGNAPVPQIEDKRPTSEIIGDNLPF